MTPEGQFQCTNKLHPQGNRWEAPNGQIECSEKREVTTWAPCWDPNRGEIECKSRRDAQSNCYETPDGQIHCTNTKRQAGTESGKLL